MQKIITIRNQHDLYASENNDRVSDMKRYLPFGKITKNAVRDIAIWFKGFTGLLYIEIDGKIVGEAWNGESMHFFLYDKGFWDFDYEDMRLKKHIQRRRKKKRQSVPAC